MEEQDKNQNPVPADTEAPLDKNVRLMSPTRMVVRRFFRSKLSLLGLIMVIGLFAFVMDTIGGVLFAKLMNVFLKKKINPMIGGAGISAFPMSSRVVQKLAMQEDPTNILIMHAAGANVSGQIASVVAGGLVISLVSQFL